MNPAAPVIDALSRRPALAGATTILRGVFFALAAASACALPTRTLAADYPERPIRLIVPYAPGGGADISARIIGQRLSERLGRQMAVENRPGGAANIGTLAAARSAPDGYTILLSTISTAVNVTLFPKTEFDVLRDFDPVSLFVSVPLVVLSHPGFPAQNITELIALAKANPGKFNYASGGIGTANHIAGELFKYMAGVNIAHIPYKGGGPALSDVVAGHANLLFNSTASSMEFVKQNKLRVFGITSEQRSAMFPSLPTIAESGLPGYAVGAWYGILAPAGTPPPIVNRLSSEIARTARLPEVREQLRSQGADPVGSTPEEFGRYLRAEITKWANVVKASGMTAE